MGGCGRWWEERRVYYISDSLIKSHDRDTQVKGNKEGERGHGRKTRLSGKENNECKGVALHHHTKHVKGEKRERTRYKL